MASMPEVGAPGTPNMDPNDQAAELNSINQMNNYNAVFEEFFYHIKAHEKFIEKKAEKKRSAASNLEP